MFALRSTPTNSSKLASCASSPVTVAIQSGISNLPVWPTPANATRCWRRDYLHTLRQDSVTMDWQDWVGMPITVIGHSPRGDWPLPCSIGRAPETVLRKCFDDHLGSRQCAGSWVIDASQQATE